MSVRVNKTKQTISTSLKSGEELQSKANVSFHGHVIHCQYVESTVVCLLNQQKGLNNK